MQQEIWGWLIVIYLFLGGLGAGAFVFSVLAKRGLLGKVSQGFISRGFSLAPWLLGVGTFLLVLDLATFNPFKIIRLLTEPTSMMSIGTWLLGAFLVLSVLYLRDFGRKHENLLEIAGLVLGFGVMGYTGLLLYVLKAIPLWNSAFLPILFVLSALSTGLALNLTAQLKSGFITPKLKALAAYLAAAELVVAVLWLASVASTNAGWVSLGIITSGSLAFAFYIGFVGLGLLVPIYSGIKMLAPKVALNNGETACACEHKGCVYAEYAVLFGGFCLRAVAIFGGVYMF